MSDEVSQLIADLSLYLLKNDNTVSTIKKAVNFLSSIESVVSGPETINLLDDYESWLSTEQVDKDMCAFNYFLRYAKKLKYTNEESSKLYTELSNVEDKTIDKVKEFFKSGFSSNTKKRKRTIGEGSKKKCKKGKCYDDILDGFQEYLCSELIPPKAESTATNYASVMRRFLVDHNIENMKDIDKIQGEKPSPYKFFRNFLRTLNDEESSNGDKDDADTDEE